MIFLGEAEAKNCGDDILELRCSDWLDHLKNKSQVGSIGQDMI